MKNIYNIIKQIRNTSSTNSKLDILIENKNNSQLKEYLGLVYSKADVNFYFKRKLVKSFIISNDEINIKQIENIAEVLSKRFHTGNKAIEYIQSIINTIDKESIELLQWMFDRDVHAGFSNKSLNKVWGNNFIKELPYMRCSLYTDKLISSNNWKDGVFSQRKMDGSFANIIIQDGVLEILTRQYSQYEYTEDFFDLYEELKSLNVNDVAIHGEFIIYENDILIPRELSNGLLNSILKGGKLNKNQHIHYVIWDMIPLEYFTTKSKYNIAYRDRYYNLTNLKFTKYISLVENKVVYSFDEAKQHYNDIVSNGGEGTVLKLSNGVWKSGTSKEQIKLKVEAECELKVIAFNKGLGKNESTFGSLVCQSEDGELEVSVSGFTDKDRVMIWNNQEEWINSIITVRFNAITSCNGKHSLQLPRFIEQRLDKQEADTLQNIFNIYNSKIGK